MNEYESTQLELLTEILKANVFTNECLIKQTEYKLKQIELLNSIFKRLFWVGLFIYFAIVFK